MGVIPLLLQLIASPLVVSHSCNLFVFQSLSFFFFFFRIASVSLMLILHTGKRHKKRLLSVCLKITLATRDRMTWHGGT